MPRVVQPGESFVLSVTMLRSSGLNGTYGATLTFEVRDTSGVIIRGLNPLVATITGTSRILVVEARAGSDTLYPDGTMLEVPIELLQELDQAQIRSMAITVIYDAESTELEDLLLSGTLLEGWVIDSKANTAGFYQIRVTAPDGGRTLRGTGDLLRLLFAVQDSCDGGGEIDFNISIDDVPCVEIITTPGRFACGEKQPRPGENITGFNCQNQILDNTPEPFTDVTTFSFIVDCSCDTRVAVFNDRGQEVARLVQGCLEKGKYTVDWDAAGMPEGVYFYQVKIGDWAEVRPMVLVR
jgi:hypothetical protein